MTFEDLTDQQIKNLVFLLSPMALEFDGIEKSKTLLQSLNLSTETIQLLLEAAPIVQELAFAYYEARLQVKWKAERIETFNASKPGFVYVFHLFDGIYKIGKSRNVKSRLQSIEKAAAQYLALCSCPHKPNVFLVKAIETPCYDWAEKELHWRFGALRTELSYHDRKDPVSHFAAMALTTELFELDGKALKEIEALETVQPDWWNEIAAEIGGVA